MHPEDTPNTAELPIFESVITPVPGGGRNLYVDVTSGDVSFRFLYNGMLGEKPIVVTKENDDYFKGETTPEWIEFEKLAYAHAEEAIDAYLQDHLAEALG